MKKHRSKIPRRKRFQISPILSESSSNSLHRENLKPNDESKNKASKVDENDGGGNNNVSEAISFSETSCIQSVYSPIKKSRKIFKSEEEFTSNDSAAKKAKVEIQGDESVSELDSEFWSSVIGDSESQTDFSQGDSNTTAYYSFLIQYSEENDP
ncbi:hypothetical protein MKW98_004880 [Papaver atlanticum]|uniref:Uncharacterized protein n=1 Tax=Papaver atlanticum TaxID=357466 RepID=A0AAD4RX95_9MAGN|nr:hypothetical protein MKW98_004880 [Papaver atlanticum]